ncbi:MAG TPA: glycosyltransferase [Blastocatellia bacterium]|nr:glycosyltransferase [Blastocatellia bacterium]
MKDDRWGPSDGAPDVGWRDLYPSGAAPSFAIAVLVPTYRRPEYLSRCLQSLMEQTRPPREVIVIVRDTDRESHEVVRRFQVGSATVCVTMVPVTQPGPLAAIKRGFAAVAGRGDIDLVLVIDDDAEAEPDWVERISRHFLDPSVGAVGGPTPNFIGGGSGELPPATVVGYISWYGRHIGNMYRSPSFTDVRPVQSFMGGNVAFRRTVLDCLEVEMRLIGSAVAYEVDLAFQVIGKGYQVLFDPLARVRHHEVPRPPDVESREDVARKIYSYSHNHTYVMMKHLHLWRKLAFLVYFFLRGERGSWGLVTALGETILRRRVSHWRHVPLAYRGKIAGLRAYLDYRKEQRSRLCREATRPNGGDPVGNPISIA